MNDTFEASLWSAISPPPPPALPLEGEVNVDVAVVGAGFLGLSLALHLAEANVSVAIVEAKQPGFGASGRNTGFVVPSLPGTLSPADAIARLGPEAGERLVRFVGGTGNYLFDLVRRHGIDCSAEQTGFLQPAHTSLTLARIEARVEQWSRIGQPVRLLGREETRRVTGSPAYIDALLDPTGGQINPLAYARGLAEAVRARGGAIYTDSPVTRVDRSGNRWRVECARGYVNADQVFFTTNAMVGDLLPDVRRSIIVARPHQVATQPLDESLRREILPGRQPLADLHRAVFVYRWSPDNRLLTGGLAIVNNSGSVARMAGYFLKRLKQYLPQLPELRADFAWKGEVAATDGRLPQIWSIGPGLWAPIACNGRGVAMTTGMGARLAAFVTSADESVLPVPVTSPQPKALHPLLEHGPSLWMGWNRIRDWIDDRGA